MASTITKNGAKILLDRGYNVVTTLTVPSQFKVGRNQSTVTTSDTDLTDAVPISNGTVNDNGDNTLTGSSGGDNTTDNTVTFKVGAGVSDDTAQNLIANATNVLKIWTIADLSSLGTNIVGTQPAGFWIFVLDQTTLDKFLTSGNALEIKLGSDSSNYFSITRTASQLSIGFNWISTGTTNVEDLVETGTVAGSIDTFIFEITTNLAADAFVAGDVIYDLLRQWQESDLLKAKTSGFPVIDNNALTAELRADLATNEANGFNLDGFGWFNSDSPILMQSADNHASESKSDTDEFIFITKDQIVPL